MVGVGVARACILPTLLVARPLAPTPHLPLVTVPLPPSSPSRQPLRWPRGAVLVRAFFFAAVGGRGGRGGAFVLPFPLEHARCGHDASTWRGTCLRGRALLPVRSLFPSWPPCCPSGVLFGGGMLLFGSLRYPSCLVPPPLEASMMHAQCKHNHQIVIFWPPEWVPVHMAVVARSRSCR